MQFDTALRLWPAASTIILFILQGAFFIIIKFNDIAHLHKEVQRLGCETKETSETQVEIRERLANMEGKLDLIVAHVEAANKK